MIRVNLLSTSPGTAPPREWFPREQRSAIVGVSMLILTAASVGGWWWYLHQSRATVQGKIATANAELERLKNVAALVERVTARKTELTERLALIERLRSTMRAPVSLLETVSRSLPEGLWLVDLKQTGTAVQIEGRATSLSSVTDFTGLVQESGLFLRPVEIVTTTSEVLEETNIIRFVVKAESATASPPPSGAATTKTMPAPAPVPAPAPTASAGTPGTPGSDK
jgi:type IV pilus assembly protein PilN